MRPMTCQVNDMEQTGERHPEPDPLASCSWGPMLQRGQKGLNRRRSIHTMCSKKELFMLCMPKVLSHILERSLTMCMHLYLEENGWDKGELKMPHTSFLMSSLIIDLSDVSMIFTATASCVFTL